MRYLVVHRRQEYALHYLLLEMAACQAALQSSRHFQTLDGELVTHAAGQRALRSGTALLIGGLLVGIVSPETGRE